LREVSEFKLAARVLWHDVAREVCLNLIGRKPIDRALVEVADLANQICTLLDQLALWLLSELAVEFSMELFKLDHLLVLHCLDAIKRCQLVFGLRS